MLSAALVLSNLRLPLCSATYGCLSCRWSALCKVPYAKVPDTKVPDAKWHLISIGCSVCVHHARCVPQLVVEAFPARKPGPQLPPGVWELLDHGQLPSHRATSKQPSTLSNPVTCRPNISGYLGVMSSRYYSEWPTVKGSPDASMMMAIVMKMMVKMMMRVRLGVRKWMPIMTMIVMIPLVVLKPSSHSCHLQLQILIVTHQKRLCPVS